MNLSLASLATNVCFDVWYKVASEGLALPLTESVSSSSLEDSSSFDSCCAFLGNFLFDFGSPPLSSLRTPFWSPFSRLALNLSTSYFFVLLSWAYCSSFSSSYSSSRLVTDFAWLSLHSYSPYLLSFDSPLVGSSPIRLCCSSQSSNTSSWTDWRVGRGTLFISISFLNSSAYSYYYFSLALAFSLIAS